MVPCSQLQMQPLRRWAFCVPSAVFAETCDANRARITPDGLEELPRRTAMGANGSHRRIVARSRQGCWLETTTRPSHLVFRGFSGGLGVSAGWPAGCSMSSRGERVEEPWRQARCDGRGMRVDARAVLRRGGRRLQAPRREGARVRAWRDHRRRIRARRGERPHRERARWAREAMTG
jgi:hypothetical protein